MRYLIILFSLLFIVNTSFAHNDDHYLFNELTKIAKAGNPEAQYHLGMLFNNGIGTEKDIAQAFYWFEKAALAGDPLGHYKIGCYYSGQGEGVIELDKKKSLEHKLIAAESGYVRAQYDVAAKYYQDKEMEKAIYWWEQAAKQGYPDAVYALFSMYYGKSGMPRDAKIAYGYLKIIESNTGEELNDKIEPLINELHKELSSEQIQEAKNFADKWSVKKTPLTIKAFAGIKESWRIVGEAQGIVPNEIKTSLRDTFYLNPKADWDVELKKGLMLRAYDYSIKPKSSSSFNLMLFFKADTPDLAQFNSPNKIRNSVLTSSQKYKPYIVEKEIKLVEVKEKGTYGYYTILTDKELVNQQTIPNGEFIYMTRGMIRLSEDSALGYSIMTNDIDSKLYQELLDYIYGFIKRDQ